MSNYKCMNCGAEYDSIPFEGCSTPGCRNTNPAMFRYIGGDHVSAAPAPVLLYGYGMIIRHAP